MRTVRFARENGIGIRLAGGNKVGIFICDVQYGSPAERAGLRVADKILRVNGADYSSLTREQAVHHILLLQNQIEMQVALCQADYEAHAFDPLGGDSFYVRAHFNYASRNPVDLTFAINDVLHVTDTLYNGVMGQWVATKLSSEVGRQQERGTVPNQAAAEQLVLSAETIDGLMKAETGPPAAGLNLHAIGASARMSIRKKLGKSGLAKRSKSASRSAANSDSEGAEASPAQPQVKVSKANTFAGSKYPAYERVVLKEVNFTRPVVVFGALSDVARERLRAEEGNRFEVPESYSGEGAAGVIKLAAIKAIIDAGKHCLLDVTPNAVEHLNYAQYFPVCVFLEADSVAQVKEARGKYARGAKPKSAKRLYENAARLDKFYSHLFTARLSTDSGTWPKKLREIVEQQQKMPLWISQELDDLLSAGPAPATPVDNYDSGLQEHHKLIAKQSQLLQTKQQQQQQHFRYNVFNDNFELPLNSMHVFSSAISGAASTYSLYEDQNYRSSFAASDTDLNTEAPQPIYSTNFNNNNNSTPSHSGRQSNYMQQQESTPASEPPQPPLHRFTSDSSVAKYATYNPDTAKNAFIQKTAPPDTANYRRLSASGPDYAPPQLPAQPPRNRNFNAASANYKLIKNSGSSLMNGAHTADTSMHYTDLAENAGFPETNETSLVEKLNKLKMGESIASVMNPPQNR